MTQLDNNKFLIIKSIKSFILDLENLLITFPKKDIFTKDRIYNDTLEVLELVYKANYETRIDYKKTYQIEAITKINKLDFYLERAYKLHYISEKQLLSKCNKLAIINKMLYKWCING